jgi:hypothetical protein
MGSVVKWDQALITLITGTEKKGTGPFLQGLSLRGQALSGCETLDLILVL